VLPSLLLAPPCTRGIAGMGDRRLHYQQTGSESGRTGVAAAAGPREHSSHRRRVSCCPTCCCKLICPRGGCPRAPLLDCRTENTGEVMQTWRPQCACLIAINVVFAPSCRIATVQRGPHRDRLARDMFAASFLSAPARCVGLSQFLKHIIANGRGHSSAIYSGRWIHVNSLAAPTVRSADMGPAIRFLGG
jgi:hypothetical protein